MKYRQNGSVLNVNELVGQFVPKTIWSLVLFMTSSATVINKAVQSQLLNISLITYQTQKL